MYSWVQRLRSLRHGFWYGVSERIRWSRGAFVETPARVLCTEDLEQGRRIAALRDRYQVQFEQTLSAQTSANNYEYLDVLDRGWGESGVERRSGGVLCDIGCASFWYAPALQAFFQPDRMIGVEIEGHRLFRDGRTRVDYAAGYLAPLPNTEFRVADYTTLQQPADVITAWFPFLTAAAILAWRLPLSLLVPERIFRQIQHNLRPGGLFFMVNHGPAEWALAERLCVAAGLKLVARHAGTGPLSRHRLEPPVLSWWSGP
jgi:SAM-dependent methyltransferase